MEMVKDQGERATAGWTGFMGRPTTKETAQRSIYLLSKRWFYTQVHYFLYFPAPFHYLFCSPLKVTFTSEVKEDASFTST